MRTYQPIVANLDDLDLKWQLALDHHKQVAARLQAANEVLEQIEQRGIQPRADRKFWVNELNRLFSCVPEPSREGALEIWFERLTGRFYQSSAQRAVDHVIDTHTVNRAPALGVLVTACQTDKAANMFNARYEALCTVQERLQDMMSRQGISNSDRDKLARSKVRFR